jgi:hypothetical protein
MKYYNSKNIQLTKIIFIFILFISLVLWLLFDNERIIVSEFKMLTEEKVLVSGEVVSFEMYEDINERYDHKVVDIEVGYVFCYNYKLPNGALIKSCGVYEGESEEYRFYKLPFTVEVEYLLEDPEVSRVRNLGNESRSLLEWLRRRILTKLILLCVLSVVGFSYFNSIIKEYRKLKDESTDKFL